jgi:phosphoribosylglycinamide formyltransferase 1
MQIAGPHATPMAERKRIAVLISGSGSNLQALIDDAALAEAPYAIALVLSNKADAYGLVRAEKAGLATAVISHRNYNSREAFDAAMNTEIEKANPDLVCLAGFMRILTPVFINRWQGKLINIHPSLLPKFKGLHTHQRALEAGEKEHGCTIHWVVPDLDSGEIIAQARVQVVSVDTEETLAARVLAEEHKLYPAIVRQLLQAGGKR